MRAAPGACMSLAAFSTYATHAAFSTYATIALALAGALVATHCSLAKCENPRIQRADTVLARSNTVTAIAPDRLR